MLRQQLDQELNSLKTEIAHLGGLVESAVGKALTALRKGDTELADQVSEGDNAIDDLEVKVEEHILKLMALFSPVARDLRFLVTVLKVNNLLEFMGDLAESIARKVYNVPVSHLDETRIELVEMGAQTQKMVMLSLDALLQQDTQKAHEVIQMDDCIDQFHRRNHRVIADTIEDSSKSLRLSELSMLSVSRSLERIADMASAVAQDVIYCVDAEIIRHRPGRQVT